jgi:hypothetical protein
MQAIPSIALVVIDRKESRCIKRCLLHVRDFVDRMGVQVRNKLVAAYQEVMNMTP